MVYRRLVRGFTRIELLAVVGIAVLIVVLVLATVLPRRSHVNHGGRYLRDSLQVRGIVQAMAIWAGNNQNRYPLPSTLDLDDATVAETGPAKDTTANILSLMVFNGSVPVEILISPAEANGNIQQCTTYEFSAPKASRVPAKALWDPGLSADFTGRSIGNTSYAHLLPSGPRLVKWSDTFNQTEAVLGNRGPQIASVSKNADGTVKAAVVDPQSNTFLIHGGRTTWEGNVGFNDSHVDFTVNLTPEATSGLTYRDASGKPWPDVFFYDEPDDVAGANAFLGIFIRAGSQPADFSAIWD